MRQLLIVAFFSLFFLSPLEIMAQPEVAQNNFKSVNQNQENLDKVLSKNTTSLVISFIKLKLLLDNDDLSL